MPVTTRSTGVELLDSLPDNMPPKGKRKQKIETEDEESTGVYDSDDIDDESAVEVLKARTKSKTRLAKKSHPPAKKKRRVNDDPGEVELKDGQQVVGVVVQAPKTGLVPPGQISQNTLDFLGKLSQPECNNRTW